MKAAVATKLINEGNLTGAQRLLGEALAADPEDPRSNALLALLHHRRGQFKSAVGQANTAIGLAPTADAFRFKALALMELKRLDEAIEAADAAVRAEPTNGLAAITQGIVLEKGRQPAKAKAAFERAVELSPHSSNFHGNLGLFLLRQGDVAAAERIAVELDPSADDLSVLMLRGHLALYHRRSQEARDFALWVLSRDANNKSALRLLILAKEHQNWILGLWWRFMIRMVRLARIRQWVFIFLAPALIGIIVHVKGVGFFTILYALFAAYIYSGSFVLRMTLKRELKQVMLRSTF